MNTPTPKQMCEECRNLPEGEVVSGHDHVIASPFTQFNYDEHRDATTIVAMKRIYKLFGESGDLLTFDSKATNEQINAGYSAVAQKILEILIEDKVPDCDMKFLIESFQVGMHQVFSVIARQKQEIEREFLARTIGAKNPGVPEQFSREYVTFGDLFKAVVKIRTEQDPDGTNGSYFRMEKQG